MNANNRVGSSDGRRAGPRGTVAVASVPTAHSGRELERRAGPERLSRTRLRPGRLLLLRLENELHPLAPGAVHDLLARADVLDGHGEQLFDGLERRAAVIEHHGRTNGTLDTRARKFPRNHSTRRSDEAIAGRPMNRTLLNTLLRHSVNE